MTDYDSYYDVIKNKLGIEEAYKEAKEDSIDRSHVINMLLTCITTLLSTCSPYDSKSTLIKNKVAKSLENLKPLIR